MVGSGKHLHPSPDLVTYLTEESTLSDPHFGRLNLISRVETRQLITRQKVLGHWAKRTKLKILGA